MAILSVFSYSSSPVTTGAYTTLVVTSPFTVSKLQICDTSGELLKIAIGLPGQEVDVFSSPISGCMIIPIYLIKGQRLAIQSLTNTASNGYNTIAFLNE